MTTGSSRAVRRVEWIASDPPIPGLLELSGASNPTLSSPKREEVFASVASNILTCVDPSQANHVGLSMDVADMGAFQAVMESEAGVAANEYDGVHPDTVAVYVAS